MLRLVFPMGKGDSMRVVIILITEIFIFQCTSSQERMENLKVRISATSDTITLKFLRTHLDTKLEGYILGYGSSMFSKQFIQLPENGEPYETEIDAEPKYLIAVKPAKTNKVKKQCPGKAILEKPLHLVIGSVTPTSVLLSWGTLLKTPYSDASLDDCIEEGQFTVRFKEKESDKDWNYQTCPTTDTVIDNLKPDTSYEFGVRAESDSISGAWSPQVAHNTADTDNDEQRTSPLNWLKPQKPTIKSHQHFLPPAPVRHNISHSRPTPLLGKPPSNPIVRRTYGGRGIATSTSMEALFLNSFTHAHTTLPHPNTNTFQSQHSKTFPLLRTEQEHYITNSLLSTTATIKNLPTPTENQVLTTADSLTSTQLSTTHPRTSQLHSTARPLVHTLTQSHTIQAQPTTFHQKLTTLQYKDRTMQPKPTLVPQTSQENAAKIKQNLLTTKSQSIVTKLHPTTTQPHYSTSQTHLTTTQQKPITAQIQIQTTQANSNSVQPTTLKKQSVTHPRPKHTTDDPHTTAQDQQSFILTLTTKGASVSGTLLTSSPNNGMQERIVSQHPTFQDTAYERTIKNMDSKTQTTASAAVQDHPRTSSTTQTPPTTQWHSKKAETTPKDNDPPTSTGHVQYVAKKPNNYNQKTSEKSNVNQKSPWAEKQAVIKELPDRKEAPSRTLDGHSLPKPAFVSEVSNRNHGRGPVRNSSSTPSVTHPSPPAAVQKGVVRHPPGFIPITQRMPYVYRNNTRIRGPGRGPVRNSSSTPSVTHPSPPAAVQKGVVRQPPGFIPITQRMPYVYRNNTRIRGPGLSGEKHKGLLLSKPSKNHRKHPENTHSPLQIKKKPNQVEKQINKDKVTDLKQMEPLPVLKPQVVPTTEKTLDQKPTPTTPVPFAFNASHLDNSSLFSSFPTSDVDAMGRKRFVASHVLYKTGKPLKEPCSVTHSLSYFPDEEIGEINVTGPPKNPPTNLTVVTVEGCPSFVILDWEKADNETTEYEVTSSTKGPKGKEVSTLTTNQTHTAVENLKPESSYEFVVTPKNELGSGPASEPVTFNTESADPRVSEMPTGKTAIWSSVPFKADSYSECNGRQYIKRTWYRKFVGIQLCNSLRYKIYLSDSLKGKFYSIGDQTGYGEDHCQFVDSFLDGRTGGPISFNELPAKEGYFRAMRQEPVKFGMIGGNSHINYVAWYECGIPIPGSW